MTRLLTCSKRRTINALLLSFLSGTCKSLKDVNRFISVALPSSWMSDSSLRDNREFLRNVRKITCDLSKLPLPKPISTNFVMTDCVLLLTLIELSLFTFFLFDFCCLSCLKMFNWVALLALSNRDSALFSFSKNSSLTSCCDGKICFGSDGSSTEEECNLTTSRRASAN